MTNPGASFDHSLLMKSIVFLSAPEVEPNYEADAMQSLMYKAAADWESYIAYQP